MLQSSPQQPEGASSAVDPSCTPMPTHLHRMLRASALVIPTAACLAILSAKLLLIWRININWDEFWFLTHAHSAARGELTLFLQGAYAHAFTWLTDLASGEVGQIAAARMVMWALLAVTAVLVWRLATRWVSPVNALIAPLCFLSMSPILTHGASFRSDSLLAPLTMATLLLAARQRSRMNSLLCAGVCLGISGVISPKAALLLPVLVLLITDTARADERRSLKRAVIDIWTVGLSSALVAGALLALHKMSLSPGSALEPQSASALFQKVFLDVPFFPRREHYEYIRHVNNVAWLLIYAGALCAIFRGHLRGAASLILALAPILLYRNAWPYYYVVMLAPASVLAAIAVAQLQEFVLPLQRFHAPAWVAPTFAILLTTTAVGHVRALWPDRQERQRALIDAVHEIFPSPVAYIDHSGMISSFPKVNFFMSTWGVENYRAAGNSFMEPALKHRPPLLLANRSVLTPDTLPFFRLLKRDQELIEKFYVPYWGPIRVAGALATVRSDVETALELPFPGKYRLNAERAMFVDGRLVESGDTVECLTTVVRIRMAEDASLPSEETQVSLAWAAAGKPPEGPAPTGEWELYDPL